MANEMVKVYADADCKQFLFSATIENVTRLLGCRHLVADRVMHELADQPYSTIHFNGRSNAFDLASVCVVKAVL